MRRVFACIFFFSLFAVFSCSEKERDQEKIAAAEAPPSVKVIAKTDRARASVSESILYTISVSYDPEIKVDLPEPGAKIAGLRITDFGEKGPEETDGKQLYEKWFKLQPDIVGTYIIPSMTVSYTEKNGDLKKLKTPQIFLEVTSALVDEKGEKSTDIIDIKPLQKIKRDLKPFILAACAAIAAGFALAGFFFYLKKRKKSRLEKKRPAHVIAFEEIKKLEKDNLIERGIIKEHYFRLSDIFRTYIENRFKIPAVEQTTPELVPEIKKLEKIDSQIKSTTEEFLKYSDLVKFAKYSPRQEEIETNKQKVLTVIAETKEAEETGHTE